MKGKIKHLAVYGGTLGLFLFLIYSVLKFGSQETSSANLKSLDWQELVQSHFSATMSLPLTHLLLQILVVVVSCRIFSSILKSVGQTKVIGEIIAGIVLGKSVFAVLWPEGFLYLFPEQAMPRLYFLSQMGLILFMFVVGLELNLKSLKGRAATAMMVSHSSILLPFLLGVLISVFMFENYAPKGVAFSSFALFMGIAMSITAFPVLARIIKEKNLIQTPLGSMALTCAAVDDITAWCALAAVVGIVKAGNVISALGVFACSAVYIAAMIYMVGPKLEAKLKPQQDAGFSAEHFGLVFVVVLSSSLIAEVIGIHALFGAFLAGSVMPQDLFFRAQLVQRVEDVSAVVLLPLFFAFTGLRTQLGLLSSRTDLLVCLLVISLAVLGKILGSALPAKFTGMSWRDSWSLGALMNTRGLMELVVLNIGYDLGVLSPAVFSMMVVMALVTTAMTGPLLNLLSPATDGSSDYAGVMRGSHDKNCPSNGPVF